MTPAAPTPAPASQTQVLLDAAQRQTATINPPAGYDCSSASVYPIRAGAQTSLAYHCVPIDGAPCKAYVHTVEFPKYTNMFPSPLPSVSNTDLLEKVLYPNAPISTLTCLREVPDETYTLDAGVPLVVGDSPLPTAMRGMVANPPPPSVATTDAARKAICEKVVMSVPASLSDLDAFPTSDDVQALYDRVNQYSLLVPQLSTSPSNASLGYPKWISVDGVPQTSGIALVLKSTGKRVAQFHHGTNATLPCGFPRYTTDVTTSRTGHCTQCVDDDNVCSNYEYRAGPVVNGTPSVDADVANPVCASGAFAAIAATPCAEMEDTRGTPFSEIIDPNVLSVWNCTPYFAEGSFQYTCSGQLADASASLKASDFEVQAYQRVDCDEPTFAACVTGLVDILQRDLMDANRTTQRRTLGELRYDLPPETADGTLLDRLKNSYVNWTMEPGCYTLSGETLVKTDDEACSPVCSTKGAYVCGGKSYNTLLDALQDTACSSSGDTPCIPYACPGATVTECNEGTGVYWVTSPDLEGMLGQFNVFRSPSDWVLGDQRVSAQGNVQFSSFVHAPLKTTTAGNIASVRQLLTHGIIANTCHASQLDANQVDRYSVVISDPESVAAVTDRIFTLTNTGCVHAQSGKLVGTPWNVGTAKMVADPHQLNNSAFGRQMGYDPSVGCSAAPSAQNPNIGGSAWAGVLGELCADRVIACETGCKYPLYSFDGGETLPSDGLTAACGCAKKGDTCALCIDGKKAAASAGGFSCDATASETQTQQRLPLPSITHSAHIWQTSSAVHADTRIPTGVSQSDVNGYLSRIDWACSTTAEGTTCSPESGLTSKCALGTYHQTGSTRGGCYIDDVRFELATVPTTCETLPGAGECAPCRGKLTTDVSGAGQSFTDATMASMCAPGGVCVYNNKVMPYMYRCHEPRGLNLDAFTTSLANTANTLSTLGNPGMGSASYEVCHVCSLLPEADGSKSAAMCKHMGGTWYDGSMHTIAHHPHGSYEVSAGCNDHVMDWKCTVVDQQQIECTTTSIDASTVDIDLESDVSNTPQATAALAPTASDANDVLTFRAYTHISKYENNQSGDLYGLDRYHARLAQYADRKMDVCVDTAPSGTRYIAQCDPHRGAQLSNALGYLYG